MRMILALLTLLILSSCILHEQYRSEILKSASANRIFMVNHQGAMVKCKPWIPPYLPPPPLKPTIPEKLIGNVEAEQEILIKSLDLHRRYISKLRHITKESYNRYTQECLAQQ